MKLYVTMIGGKLPNHRLEVHDIEVHLAEHECGLVDACRAKNRALSEPHIDGWIVLPVADDGDAPDDGDSLFLLELGQNQAGHFFERHDYRLVAAENRWAAIRNVKAQAASWHVDSIMDLSRLAVARGAKIAAQGAIAAAQQVSRYVKL